MEYSHIKALLIDIDGTIVDYNPPQASAFPADLFYVLESAGTKLAGLSPAEVRTRIEAVKAGNAWWHWSDFIVALELDPGEFWAYAIERESVRWEPTGLEIRPALERLQAKGVILYITSNNPSSGILYKLSIAGLATMNGSGLFHQLMGPPELRAMKWEPLFWRKALAHIGMSPGEVAVVGDNPKDDLEIPQSVGISHTFLINRREDRSAENGPRVTHIQSFTQISDCLLNGKPKSALAFGPLAAA